MRRRVPILSTLERAVVLAARRESNPRQHCKAVSKLNWAVKKLKDFFSRIRIDMHNVGATQFLSPRKIKVSYAELPSHPRLLQSAETLGGAGQLDKRLSEPQRTEDRTTGYRTQP